MATSVAIQGDVASFHDIAARRFFSQQSQPICCDTFDGTFKALDSGEADYAVCAIENSLYGSINEVYDLLLRYNFSIIGEVYLRIEQCLIGLPGANIRDLKEVYSHPVALAQCERYFETMLPNTKLLELHDTAASVVFIKTKNDPTLAAVASEEAATLHGMSVLASSIETNQQNYTRFMVLSKTKSRVEGANKTSLVIRTRHTPGALYNALGAFATLNINLSKLQSRPIIGKSWHYMFYVDVEAGANEPAFQQAIDALLSQGCDVQILGSYLHGTQLSD